MNVALVHDYLNQRGGAERVFSHVAAAYPEAPVYTALFDPAKTGDFVDASRVRATYLSRIPGANRYFRYLAPFYPRAFERMDFSAYDTIISTSSAWAKGILVPPGAIHVCYLHTVSRFVFAYDDYVGALQETQRNSVPAPLVKAVVARLAQWDKRAAARPTRLIANSRNVARRIEHYYGRQADVLHPPVEVRQFPSHVSVGDHFFIVSRLLPYKRIDLAIRAADRAGVPLVVAGAGPSETALRELARGTTTTMLGFVSDERVRELLASARAALLPGEEDFGLLPLEAAACGRPTIALRAGGAVETIVEGETGEFFDEPSVEFLANALRNFDERRYDPSRIRAQAQTFSPERFIAGLRAIVDQTRAGA